jgi:hypothetical protein
MVRNDNTVEPKNRSNDTSDLAAPTVDDSDKDNNFREIPLFPMEKSSSSFMESMTFTSVQPTCDCDECCSGTGSSIVSANLPETIRLAVKEHKRRKLSQAPLKRSQVRTLIGRRRYGDENIAVWNWAMPPSAEPFVEFGNPLMYRIVWIRRLHPRSIIKQIGTGVLGSRSEEQGRVKLDWMEDDVILISNEGKKSIGYIVETLPDSVDDGDHTKPTVTKRVGPAELYIAKVPLAVMSECTKSNSVDDDSKSIDDNGRNFNHSNPASPYDIIRRICIRTIQSNSPTSQGANTMNVFPIENTDKQLFRQSILSLIQESRQED